MDNAEESAMLEGPHSRSTSIVGAARFVALLALGSLSTALFADDVDAPVERGQPSPHRISVAPDYGNRHVAAGSAVASDDAFPLSRPRWPKPTASGFYKEPQAKGETILTLEHGRVVIHA